MSRPDLDQACQPTSFLWFFWFRIVNCFFFFFRTFFLSNLSTFFYLLCNSIARCKYLIVKVDLIFSFLSFSETIGLVLKLLFWKTRCPIWMTGFHTVTFAFLDDAPKCTEALKSLKFLRHSSFLIVNFFLGFASQLQAKCLVTLYFFSN